MTYKHLFLAVHHLLKRVQISMLALKSAIFKAWNLQYNV